MIERVTEQTDRPATSLREDLEALRVAAQQRRWSDFVRALPRATALVEKVTQDVVNRWNRLSEDDQDLVLLAKSQSDEWAAMQPLPNFLERFRSGPSDAELLRQYNMAVGGFRAVVDNILREEERVRALLDSAMVSDPDVKARLALGVAEESEGRGTTYTPEEFRARFNLS